MLLDLNDGRLRILAGADLEKVLEWRNSDAVRSNMYTDHIITLKEHRDWFRVLQSNTDSIYLVFEFKCRPVGLVYFTAINRLDNRCHWGFYLGEDGLPSGTGTIMGFLGLEYAFEKVGIRKVTGESFAFNEKAIKFHKKLGFIEEGILRKHVLKNGTYQDIVIMATFEEDWLRNKSSVEERYFVRSGAIDG